MTDKAALALANDNLRTTGQGGITVMTSTVRHLPPDTQARAIKAMREFNQFTADNDPYGEHDFGSFTVDGQNFFWKIDYTDEEHKNKILTLMLAEDY